MLTQEEKNALISEVGEQGAKRINAIIETHDKKQKDLIDQISKEKGLTEDQLKQVQERTEEVKSELESVLKQQGKTLGEIKANISAGGKTSKSLAQVLKENEEQIKSTYNAGQGIVNFEVFFDKKGNVTARPFNYASKAPAATAHGTVDALGGADNLASVAQSLSAAAILRLGADGDIVSQYRNTPYIFDLCNTTQTNSPLAIWINETDKEGASSTVAEGGTKPLTQYKYSIESASYKKEATLLTFTDEFNMDFGRLQQDAVEKGRIDVINRINTAILPNITSAATAYNTGSEFQDVTNIPDGEANDFHALAAMAAQVDSATFGASMANTALMSTFQKYGLGVTADSQGAWLNAPDVIGNLAFVGNPGMTGDNVIVGDFNQYNILLRGGMIMRVGYNGTDFAENKFSVVLEQFYFDYISDARKPALVKGPDFATVKAAIDQPAA